MYFLFYFLDVWSWWMVDVTVSYLFIGSIYQVKMPSLVVEICYLWPFAKTQHWLVEQVWKSYITYITDPSFSWDYNPCWKSHCEPNRGKGTEYFRQISEFTGDPKQLVPGTWNSRMTLQRANITPRHLAGPQKDPKRKLESEPTPVFQVWVLSARVR